MEITEAQCRLIENWSVSQGCKVGGTGVQRNTGAAMKQINQVLIVYLGIPVFCPRHQVIVIEYLQAENSMLQERL
ncbi:MAG: hypothetical protein WKF61_08300, partial [Luteimonas sp.]